MSEELRQKGYLDKRGRARGDAVGEYEGFNLGATTLDQLRRACIIPDLNYGKHKNNKPDGIVVDRRGEKPLVKFVVEYKDRGHLGSETKTRDFMEKVADEYCRPLHSEFGGISDHQRNSWLLVSPDGWKIILREDEYPLDYPIDLASEMGRSLLGDTLVRLDTSLNKPNATLVPDEVVNPTKLADQTWQDIWLACGAQPEACLATFVELLIFKFLSDLKILGVDSSGVEVDFDTVVKKTPDIILNYYYEHTRPAIKKLFPAGADGTSIINGMGLDQNVKDQGRLFLQILERFKEFGSLRRIDPEFKSRIFERFLKKSLSVKNWGQYFTPRNVVKAVVEMSGIDRLPPGSLAVDPACGVGGFVLEPLMNKRPHDFRSDDAPNLRYRGWDRDDKTIILAKANMLVHLSEVLEKKSSAEIPKLAAILNDTFSSVSSSITGTLANPRREEFDLVMTNPPYVVRGAGRLRDFLKQNVQTADFYSIPGAGIENLFVQFIINGLKPGARALVIVPDGLLLRHSEEALRAFILKTCLLEAIVSLPKDTFYSTPKKTYILVIRKKQDPADIQTAPVFTYLIGEVGETRDAKRFIIADNDLPKMAAAFQLFQGNPAEFQTTDRRCRTVPIREFKPEDHWLINKWWSLEERESLGDLDEESFVNSMELSGVLKDAAGVLERHSREIASPAALADVRRTVTVSLSDKSLFRMGIGKRVLRKELFHAAKGTVPLYSANVEIGSEHGWLQESNLTDFSKPSLLWSIDSDFNMTVRFANDVFATTDHCGRIEILNPALDPVYCQAAIIYGFGRTFGFDRVTRPSLRRMKKVTFKVPVLADGLTFDLASQQTLAKEYTSIKDSVWDAKGALETITELKPKANLPDGVPDIGMWQGGPDSTDKQLRKTFNGLAKTWRKETGMMSVIHQKTSNPSYKKIIGLGKPVVPFVLKELQQKREHWLIALREITGEDAAKPGDNFQQAAAAWIEWGKRKGHL